MLRADNIRGLVNEHGIAGYLQIQADLLEGRETPNGRKVTRRPDEFSIRALWEGLVGPVENTLAFAAGLNGSGYVEIEEAISSTGFSSAIGQLLAAKLIEGYDSPGFIGDELVTTMPSSLRGERLAGFTSLQGPKPVGELMQYEDSTFTDKFVGTRETKRGRLLSISEEAVVFDQTGQILLLASTLGEIARQERERRIVRAVIDADSLETVYAPGGTGEQLYSSGNNNLTTGNTPLVDWTDIQEVMTFHALNQTDDREPDDTLGAQPIAWMPRIILTATELSGVAARIIAATMIGTAPGDTSNVAMMTGNPLSMIGAGGMIALSSPFIDNATDGDQWDDASDWLIGDFKKQFIYKEIWPLQVFRAPAQNEEQFNRDVVAQFKVREYGDVVALDERWVMKVNAA